MESVLAPVSDDIVPAEATQPSGEAPAHPADRPGLVEQLRGLYDDSRALIDAELAFQRARVSYAGKQTRTMALLLFIGLTFLGCTLIALTVGTMIALMPLLGPWGAMGATVLGTILLAALCMWLAYRKVGNITAAFASDDEQTKDAQA
ncbi:phage holin family protein [Blastomonas sp.]|uniref:phage holin family protein n=1 Tax=Blastomonas sp. TaxID=1909299 RepID=UPI0035935605